ncbi:hypothetical protein NQZ68_032344 [Dissostichus eleginoides]|nr:hypothetical protein NQZ68_032344 [Dissostichus eleginoides]
MLTGRMPVYDSFFVWKRTKNQVALSLRLGVPLAETLVLGVVACCEGNDHKTCLDCSSQLQLKGQSTPPTRNSCSVTAARPPSQDLGVPELWLVGRRKEWIYRNRSQRLPDGALRYINTPMIFHIHSN